MLILDLSNKINFYFRSLFIFILCNLSHFSSWNFLNWKYLSILVWALKTFLDDMISIRESSLPLMFITLQGFSMRKWLLKFFLNSNRWTVMLTVFFNTFKIRKVFDPLSQMRRVEFVYFWFWTLRRGWNSILHHFSIFRGEVFLCVRSTLSWTSCLNKLLDLSPVFLKKLVSHKKSFMFIVWPSSCLKVAWCIRNFARSVFILTLLEIELVESLWSDC